MNRTWHERGKFSRLVKIVYELEGMLHMLFSYSSYLNAVFHWKERGLPDF